MFCTANTRLTLLQLSFVCMNATESKRERERNGPKRILKLSAKYDSPPSIVKMGIATIQYHCDIMSMAACCVSIKENKFSSFCVVQHACLMFHSIECSQQFLFYLCSFSTFSFEIKEIFPSHFYRFDGFRWYSYKKTLRHLYLDLCNRHSKLENF